MGDIKLFQIQKGKVAERSGTSVAVEKSLQKLIEDQMETFLGVRFLASEYGTGKRHGGRIDSMGIDENGCPVIIEYKRALNENVINQGLFYLDWLLDHKAEFKLLVMDKLGKKPPETIEWTSPRLLCIAGDFTKYDENAVQQINRSIELIRYKKFGDDLLILELVNATTAPEPVADKTDIYNYKTITETLGEIEGDILDRYEALKAFLLALGDDVQTKTLKYYVAFKRIKNFACVELHPKKGTILVYIKIDPATIKLENGFTRNVSKIGHFGTGELEITLRTDDDLEKAKRLIVKSYENS